MSAAGRVRWRLPLLLAGLAVAAWLALFGDKTPAGAPTPRAASGLAPTRTVPSQAVVSQRTAVSPARPAPTATGPGRVVPAAAAIDRLVPRDELLPPAGGPGRDLFASPPPPPLPKPVAAPPPVAARPVAPPLPFRVLGKKLESGTWEVFLGREEGSFIVRAGSLLESNYRVERIEPPSMVLTHLPTGQTQTLMIGDAW